MSVLRMSTAALHAQGLQGLMQQQQKVKEIVTDAVQKVEDNLDEMKAAAEEKK